MDEPTTPDLRVPWWVGEPPYERKFARLWGVEDLDDEEFERWLEREHEHPPEGFRDGPTIS